MKTKIVLALVLALLSASAYAQYSVSWYKIAGGGGTSTGGVFSVSGTIGQHDAGGPLTGGVYSLVGGFWALAAVQTPGGPWLTVLRTATNTVVVTWPLPDTGWKLHWSATLGSGAIWTEVPPPYQTVGPNLHYLEPSPVGSRFYRLHKP